jgi:hypothetical protein
MPMPSLSGVSLLVAAFAAGGHGKPDPHAQVTVTQPPQIVQRARPTSQGNQKGWWFAAELFNGTYVIAAHVPHQVCASVSVTVPSESQAQYEVRIDCKR